MSDLGWRKKGTVQREAKAGGERPQIPVTSDGVAGRGVATGKAQDLKGGRHLVGRDLGWRNQDPGEPGRIAFASWLGLCWA